MLEFCVKKLSLTDGSPVYDVWFNNNRTAQSVHVCSAENQDQAYDIAYDLGSVLRKYDVLV